MNKLTEKATINSILDIANKINNIDMLLELKDFAQFLYQKQEDILSDEEIKELQTAEEKAMKEYLNNECVKLV